jgi:transposase
VSLLRAFSHERRIFIPYIEHTARTCRDRIIAFKEDGIGNAEIVASLRVSPSYVNRVSQQFRERGVRSPLKIGGYRVPRRQDREEVLASLSGSGA